MMVLQTECTAEMFAGFFGINADGMQPECGELVTVKVDGLDGFEADRDGVRPACEFRCPKCKASMEDYNWTIIHWDEGPQNL